MKRLLKFLLRTVAVLFLLINVIVAFHAYKFTHFYNKDEITIKKPEDKSSWDRTKEILFGINAVKQQNTNASDSAYQTITLATKDSIKLEGWFIAADSAKGTICMFHGHGGKKSGTNDEAATFHKLGNKGVTRKRWKPPHAPLLWHGRSAMPKIVG